MRTRSPDSIHLKNLTHILRIMTLAESSQSLGTNKILVKFKKNYAEQPARPLQSPE